MRDGLKDYYDIWHEMNKNSIKVYIKMIIIGTILCLRLDEEYNGS